MSEDIFTQERGVSTVVGYVLAISVTTVLLAGVILSTTQFIQFQQTETAKSQLDVVGEQIAFSAQKADTAALNRTARNATISASYNRSVPVPNRVAGKQYTVLYNDTKEELILETVDGRVERRVPLRLGGHRSPSGRTDIGVKELGDCTHSSDPAYKRMPVSSELKVEYNNTKDCVVIKNE